MSDDREHSREHLRVPATLEVQYRTTGSFLVSYSLNLSQGGIFIETEQLQPVGTSIRVRLVIPGAEEPLETDGKVIWVRSTPSPEGLPPGLGVRFDQIEESIGGYIDSLVKDFGGMVLVAVAGDAPTLDRLTSYLRSVMQGTALRATAQEIEKEGFEQPPDLVLIDLDSSGPYGAPVLERAASSTPPIPVVAASSDVRALDELTLSRVAAVVSNPPLFAELRRHILAVLGQPNRSG